MKAFIVCLLALLSIASCHRNYDKTKSLLKTIDSLAINGYHLKTDSLLKRINYSDLTNDRDKALYGLLKTQTYLSINKPVNNDSLINFSVEYFEKTGDYHHLARAYYYKGAYFYSVGKLQETLLFFKKAESTEREGQDVLLRSLIYGNLSFINSVLGANLTAIEYGKKALQLAIETNDIERRCFAYNCIATAYYRIGKKDSAFIYINKIRPYIHQINNKEDLAGYLNNIGFIYYENGLYKEAETYFNKAEAILPNSNFEINLTKTYYMLGKDRKADSLFNAVWPKANYEEKAEIMQFLAERSEKKGDFAASTRFYKEAKAIQDSANAAKETEEAVNVQREYETKEYKQGVAKSKVVWAITTVVAVALLAAWGAVYHRRKMNRAKEMIERGNKLTAEYTARITELERADTRHSHEAQELRRKIKKLKDEQNAILSRGQQLYNGIMAGGTTATWKKQDFDKFIEFYRVAHPQAVADAENGYRRLSSTNIFYLILRDMQVPDDDAQRILCMTAGAMRTMKSRINARKTD